MTEDPDVRGAIELVLARIEHDGPCDYADPLVGGLVELVRLQGVGFMGATIEQLRDWLQFALAALDLDDIPATVDAETQAPQGGETQ